MRALYRVSGEKEWRELTPSRVRNNEIHLLATDSLIEVISYADEYTGTHPVYSEESLVVDGSNEMCIRDRCSCLYSFLNTLFHEFFNNGASVVSTETKRIR